MDWSGDVSLKGTDGEGVGREPVTAASGLKAADTCSAGAQCLVPTADGNNSCLGDFQLWCVCIDIDSLAWRGLEPFSLETQTESNMISQEEFKLMDKMK